jgi:hypothetical protein
LKTPQDSCSVKGLMIFSGTSSQATVRDPAFNLVLLL